MKTFTHITKEIYILSPLSLYWHADHLPALCCFLFLVEGGGQVVEVALMIIFHLFTMNSCTKLCNIIMNMHKPLLSSDENVTLSSWLLQCLHKTFLRHLKNGVKQLLQLDTVQTSVLLLQDLWDIFAVTSSLHCKFLATSDEWYRYFFLFKVFLKLYLVFFYGYPSKWLIVPLVINDSHLPLSEPCEILCSFFTYFSL